MLIWWLLGCGGDCGAGDLEPGSASATIDGEAWEGTDVVWSWAGSGLQVTSESSGGWLLSIAAQADTQGRDLEAAAADGDFPIEVDLGEGSFALLYPEEGGSYASNKGAGGTLSIDEISEVVSGCLSFEAASADGETLTLEGGTFLAVSF